MVLIYKFYLDVFAIQNFFMNGAIILLTLWAMKYPVLPGIRRIIIWDILGIVLSVFLLLLPISYHCYELISFLIIIPLMCMGVLGICRRRDVLMVIIYSYIVAFLLGGISQAIDNHFGNFYIFSIVVCFISICIWNSCRKETKRLYICKLIYTNPLDGKKRSSKVTGLYDTGNVLCTKDNRPVSIVSEKILGLLNVQQEPILLSYSTVAGVEVMEVYKIDCLKIFQNGKEISINSAYIGKMSNQILKDKKYQMILNGGVFDETDYKETECSVSESDKQGNCKKYT